MNKYRAYIIPLFILSVLFLISEKYDDARFILLTPEFNFKDTSVHQRYGDLYRLCKVDDFIEGMYYANKPPNATVPDSADVFIIGDSYFERSIGESFLNNDLEKLTGIKIYDLSSINGGAADNPLGALLKLDFNKNKRRILLYETTERFSVARATKRISGSSFTLFPEYNAITGILYRVFLIRQFYIENNIITLPLIRAKNTINFEVFNVMDRNIGAYSVNPPILFYDQDLDFAEKTILPRDAETTADRINEFKKILDKDFNISLFYVVVPDKYSIYNDLVTGKYKYSGFIPELVMRLNEKKIYTIDLYTLFMKHKQLTPGELLYYKSDSHFNKYGKEIFLKAVGNILKGLKENGGY